MPHFENLRSIASENRLALGDFWKRPDVHGVVAGASTGATRVLVSSQDARAAAKSLLKKIHGAYFGLDGQSPGLAQGVDVIPPASGYGVYGGDRAHSGAGLGTRVEAGTAGWGIFLDGEPVTISNWHVLCPNGNLTKPGVDCTVGSGAYAVAASLLGFAPVDSATVNTWDVALARLADEGHLRGQMLLSGAKTSSYPYPLALADDTSAACDYWTVGTGTPTCETGRLDCVGDVKVRLNDVLYQFSGVLIFAPKSGSRLCSYGDSGSIIVRKDTSEVVGLVFGGNEHLAYACPLFKIGWTKVDERNINGLRIPCFRSTGSPLGL